MAELRHGVRDRERCRQAVFRENGRGRRNKALDQAGNVLVPVRPLPLHDIKRQVSHVESRGRLS